MRSSGAPKGTINRPKAIGLRPAAGTELCAKENGSSPANAAASASPRKSRRFIECPVRTYYKATATGIRSSQNIELRGLWFRPWPVKEALGFGDRGPNPVRDAEQMAGRQSTNHTMVPHRGKRHRGDTSALRTIGVAAKLARRNLRFEIGRERMRRPCKDAFLRALRRRQYLPNQRRGHFELGIERPEPQQ